LEIGFPKGIYEKRIVKVTYVDPFEGRPAVFRSGR